MELLRTPDSAFDGLPDWSFAAHDAKVGDGVPMASANTGMPDGVHRLGSARWAFHDFVQRTPDLPVGFLVQGGCARTLSDAEVVGDFARGGLA